MKFIIGTPVNKWWNGVAWTATKADALRYPLKPDAMAAAATIRATLGGITFVIRVRD